MSVARYVDTRTFHRMRAVSKPLRRALESDVKQLTVTTLDGLKALKHPGAYAALERLVLAGDFTDRDLEGLPVSLKELNLCGCHARITSRGLRI
ncbi:hypothetical protein ACJBUE_14080 [Ralstonia syzygii subsp. celebesensis]|uniref:hypothetical protein n=1 Tax=Ralstonia syzygii TaxID=28097 RepID=UPI00387E0B9D